MSEEILKKISEAVEDAVDTKINGKLRDITAHLGRQDEILKRVEDLLEDKDFIVKLWAFLKFLGGAIVAIASAILIYKRIVK